MVTKLQKRTAKHLGLEMKISYKKRNKMVKKRRIVTYGKLSVRRLDQDGNAPVFKNAKGNKKDQGGEEGQLLSLQSLACNKLPCSDVSKLTDTHLELVVKPRFEQWFVRRLILSKVKLDTRCALLLKNATWNSLSTSNYYEFHSVGSPSEKLRNQRQMLGIAAEWLGLEYDETTEHARVRRILPDDGDRPVFEMRTSFEEYKKQKKQKKAKKVHKGPSISCDECGISSHEVDICISVYHDGQFCDSCLYEGACETDPEGCSKWESWNPRYAQQEQIDRGNFW